MYGRADVAKRFTYGLDMGHGLGWCDARKSNYLVTMYVVIIIASLFEMHYLNDCLVSIQIADRTLPIFWGGSAAASTSWADAARLHTRLGKRATLSGQARTRAGRAIVGALSQEEAANPLEALGIGFGRSGGNGEENLEKYVGTGKMRKRWGR